MTPEEHYRRLERTYAQAPVNQSISPTLTVSEGKAEIRFELQENFHHSAGGVHGAYYFKALDDAAFFAANSIELNYFVLTADFNLRLLRPMTFGEVCAEGNVSHAGKTVIIADAVLYDPQGNVAAVGRGSFARSKMPLGQSKGYL